MRVRCLILLLSVATLAEAQPASAQPLLDAVMRAPALRAARQRVEAAEARVDASGRLADPEVEGMASRRVGPMDDRSTMWEVNVRQPLPKRGERAADRDRARAAVAMAQAEYAVMAGDVAADVAMALAEAEGAEARIELMATQLDRLRSVLRAVETRMAAGGGQLADRLTVETRIASMQLAIEEERRRAEDARAEVRGRLALAPTQDLPTYSAPALADVNRDEAAELLLAAARAAEAEAMIRMARASAKPMTAVGLRFEREEMAMGDANTVGIAFMSEIPWRSRRYARAEIEAARAEGDAAETDAHAARYRIDVLVTRVERAEQLAETARRLGGETLDRLRAEYDALMGAAGVGGSAQSTVLQTVELLEKVTETELQVIEAGTAARMASAVLWRIVPADTFNLKPSESP